MKQYKLIKEYPGSPILGTIVSNCPSCKGQYVDQNSSKRNCYHNVENHNEFWQEITKDYIGENCNKVQNRMECLKCNYPYSESFIADDYSEHFDITKDWEILSFKTNINHPIVVETKLINQPFPGYTEKDYTGINPPWFIHSIKRLSDGEIFTIGDKCSDGVSRGEIKSFHLNDNIMNCNVCGVLSNIRMLTKIKQPLFTTEDGVELFNDCFIAWVATTPRSTWSVHIDWIGSTFVRKNDPQIKIFSTKELAEEFVIMNKPCLSINDIKEAMGSHFQHYTVEKLKKLVKAKL